ncbi:MAG: electron transport complex subunit E [Gammaproteobacteria bacterium]|nr:electron transport complex subunit E [Gammaproteobacteria bacterium]
MTESTHGRLMRQGLWHNNQALVALLGLCPLLAVTSTVVNGLGLGLATLATLVTTNVIVSAGRPWIRKEVRIPMFVLIIACVVTTIELLMSAHMEALFLALGIFLPLIVTNCAVIGRAEAFASRNPVGHAAMDGFAMGLGFLAVLVALGALRELVGHGTLMRDADILLGPWAAHLEVRLWADYRGFLPAVLPPGAFVGLALLIALKNKLDRLAARRRAGGRGPFAVWRGLDRAPAAERIMTD